MKGFLTLAMAMLCTVVIVSCQKEQDLSVVDDLLSQMTLEEKIGQMNQYSSFFDVTGPAPAGGSSKERYELVKKGLVGSMLNVRGAKEIRRMQELAVENSRLGIPLIFGYDVIHGYSTTFPIPLAEAASWNIEAIEKSARISAVEAAASGLNWTFAPMIDISRDARWGRVMEGAGEDPYLGSIIAQARVKGFQGEDLKQVNTISACAKHFAGYGFAESGKDYNTADVGLSTLYNIILPPFKAATEANVRTFMNSFNELNGVPATGNVFLQRDILKGKWGFDGFVVTDWDSMGEMIDHGFAADSTQAAVLAITAGADMDMESNLYVNKLKNLVESGKIDEKLVDDAVRRILQVKYELGLLDDPYKYCSEEREKEMIGHEDHHAAALDIAKKSIVLLKNEGELLPLKKEGQTIALIGPFADDKNSPLGNWRGGAIDNSAVSVLEGMQKYSANDILYAKGVELVTNNPQFHSHCEINTDDRTGISEAVATASKADVVVMVVGEHGLQSGEGRSRSNIGLPGLQLDLLKAVYAVNKNIVLVLMNGRPLAITWSDEHLPAILETWQLGSQCGNAIAEILYGDYNPSGKLPMTFPRSVGQVPIYYNFKSSGRPAPEHEEVFWSHYADQTNAPLYPFGYGLSYTTFEYSDLEINKTADEKGAIVKVTVKNTGKIVGKETAQLYIHDLFASVTRPVQELKGFQQVTLTAGESQQLTFELTEKELGFFNNQGKYIVESGEFEIMVGGNCAQTLKASFTLD